MKKLFILLSAVLLIGVMPAVMAWGNECSTDSDCGTAGFVGARFCKSGDVYQNYKDFNCVEGQGYCESWTYAQLVDDCDSGCSFGKCRQTPSFSTCWGRCWGSCWNKCWGIFSTSWTTSWARNWNRCWGWY